MYFTDNGCWVVRRGMFDIVYMLGCVMLKGLFMSRTVWRRWRDMICLSNVCSLGGMVLLSMKVYLREDVDVVEDLDLRDGGEGGKGFLKERGSNCLGVNIWSVLLVVVMVVLLLLLLLSEWVLVVSSISAVYEMKKLILTMILLSIKNDNIIPSCINNYGVVRNVCSAQQGNVMYNKPMEYNCSNSYDDIPSFDTLMGEYNNK